MALFEVASGSSSATLGRALAQFSVEDVIGTWSGVGLDIDESPQDASQARCLGSYQAS